ncbi:hypothetical protein KDH_73350 [Dictyobacter sp. S3.2.2.5]|uniref:Uncharacterized protein n=1 Tax=Dictyobacter halimunensis TaxID=3026934 RepID=A0ABQ6G6T2_9CHLR|nr:hypothetical protein KDH_73350 [Dictyobacter sp. S3.2.2.5]
MSPPSKPEPPPYMERPPNVNRRVGSTFNGRPARERQRLRATYPAGSASRG